MEREGQSERTLTFTVLSSDISICPCGRTSNTKEEMERKSLRFKKIEPRRDREGERERELL